MKFCEKCGEVMQKSTPPTGGIIFQCKCQQIAGGDDDTLMDEGHLETSESTLRHVVFIENAPFDPAANITRKDCPKCGLNYLTMIRIGVNEVTMYSCSCGYKATHTQYITDFEAKSDKKAKK